MQTSGLFTVHSHLVTHNKKGLNQPLRVIIFGDVHRDSPNHADGTWKDFLAYARKQKDVLFLGMGDYVDSASTSERECLARSAFHESTQNDISKLAEAKIKLLAKELDFMRGRLIGLVNGNHYFQFADGTNTDQRLCGLLGTKYLGVCSFVRLYVKAHGRMFAKDFFLHHGKGASRLTGGSLNRVAQMAEGAEADVYVMGHDHKKGAVPSSPRLFLQNSSKGGLEVKHRDVWIVRSGSFLASYRDGEVNYNVDAARGPCSLGHVELLLSVGHEGVTIRSTV